MCVSPRTGLRAAYTPTETKTKRMTVMAFPFSAEPDSSRRAPTATPGSSSSVTGPGAAAATGARC